MSSIKIVQASQATRIYQYKNIKRKILKCCANIYFNKQCQKHKLTPNHTKIHIPHTSPAAIHTQCKISKIRIRYEIEFLYMKKTNLNKTLFQIHLQLANEWDNVWNLLHDTIHVALENKIQNTYKHLDKKLDRMKQVHDTIKTTTNPHRSHLRVINNTNITFSEDEKKSVWWLL